MTADAVGGVWTYALELARGLASRQIGIDLAVMGPAPTSGQMEQASRIDGLTVAITGLPLDWTAQDEGELDRAVQALRAHAQTSGADLVHLNAPAHAGLVRWDLPVVVSAHSCVATWWAASRSGPLPPDLAWRARRTDRGMAIADAVIVPSRSFRCQLAQTYGAGDRATVVYNARERRPSTAAARDKIFTAGRLWDAGKNAGAIDKAAALLDRPIYSAGPTHGPNGEHVTLANLALLGVLEEKELDSWYAQTAVFVSMSIYEPFGLSVLEAAQSGAALVLSDIDTFRELWHGAATFVPADDPGSLARAIDWLDRNPEGREDLARRAQERATRYSLGRQLAGTLAVYRRAKFAHSSKVRPRSAA